MKAVGSYERMAHFMIRDPAFLFLPEATALALRPSYHFLDCIFQIALSDFCRLPPRWEQGGFV
jgi:hypothetical protein